MIDIRTRINNILAEQRVLFSQHDKVLQQLDKVEFDLEYHDEARSIIQQSAQITQKNLEEHISDIVSKALNIVFLEDAKGFHVEFVTRRNTTECDLKLNDNGNLLDPLDSSGFGEADVVSFALRVAYWALGSSRNTLILDEPFKALDGVRMERVSEMVKTLSTELNLQMIIITHDEKMEEYSDKRYHVTKSKGISTVVEIKKHSSIASC